MALTCQQIAVTPMPMTARQSSRPWLVSAPSSPNGLPAQLMSRTGGR